ncbi:MAG: hypothetical protein IJ521_06645 [Schwartzia sp.]|nr:hypothetical protein [Schwartzia sp. (in: firmicutes)]
MYKPLAIDFEIPEELDGTIKAYLHHLNYESGTSVDCYQAEIQVILNWCYRDELLTEKQINLLRDYYQRDGVLRSNGHGPDC